MARPADNPIPLDEQLFRGLSTDDRAPHDEVLASAIDKKGTSVYRGKYADPGVVLEERNTAIAVAMTTGDALAPPIVTETVTVEAYAWDAPEEGNAHAEVRLLRPGKDEPGAASYEPGRLAWAIIREQIARRFVVLPTPRREPDMIA